MQLANELEDLVARVARQGVVEELADVQLHWRPLLLHHDGPIRRIALHPPLADYPFLSSQATHLVVRILQHRDLPLIQRHRRLFPLHRLEDRRHLLARRLRSKEIASAAFEGGTEVVDVGAREVVEEDFKDVKDRVGGSDAELGELGKETEVLWRVVSGGRVQKRQSGPWSESRPYRCSSCAGGSGTRLRARAEQASASEEEKGA